MEKLFKVVYEDDELLVINKPAGLVCHPTKTDGYSSLISRARLYLGAGSHPQLVNRLDRETSGVTLVAKREDAARELRRIWENRLVEKEYVAVAHGHALESHGIIDAPLGTDEQSRVAEAGGRKPGIKLQPSSNRQLPGAGCQPPSSACNLTRDGSTRSGSTWRTSAIRSSATKFTVAMRLCTWRSWRAV